MELKVSPLVCIYLSRMFHRKKLIINLVAIAYVMHKATYVFPIIGGRKVEHLLANLEALDISLSDEQIKFLEAVEPFELGFPGWMIVCAILINGKIIHSYQF